MDIIDFKNKIGKAYEMWPYKNIQNSIDNTTFFFCATAEIESSGIKKLNDYNINIIYLEYIIYAIMIYCNNLFDENDNIDIMHGSEFL